MAKGLIAKRLFDNPVTVSSKRKSRLTSSMAGPRLRMRAWFAGDRLSSPAKAISMGTEDFEILRRVRTRRVA